MSNSKKKKNALDEMQNIMESIAAEKKEELTTSSTYRIGASAKENRPALMKARRMFFEGYQYPLIFTETLIPPNVFTKHKSSWQRLQDRELDKQIQKSLREGKLKELEEINSLSLAGLRKYIARVVLRQAELSTKEAKLLSDIVANLDRIARLESGRPTDIKRYETMSPEELRKEAAQIVAELKEEDPVVDYQCH